AGTGMTLDDYRKLAGAPTSTAPSPSVPSDGIPTLTSEQFAVLTGMSMGSAAPPPELGSPSDAAVAPTSMQPGVVSEAPAGATIGPTTGAPAGVSAGTSNLGSAGPDVAAAAPELDAEPVIDNIHPNDAEPDEGEPADPRVVWVDSVPDRDERRSLQAAGKRWRLKETPGANELFLGPDGKFGWDDFVDIINPLQHIPVVSQIYRAVTGDQAYGLSQFLGAVPFGPISVANAVIDTVVRAQTGRDAGTDLAAAILGIDNRTPEEANLQLAVPPDQFAAGPDAAGPDAGGPDAGGPDTGEYDAVVPGASSIAAVPSPIPSAWTRDGGRA
ncbi:MAG: hypothetical protein JNL25_02735, partial [Rhodospirillaceae bacterium]|nr:hypothetical protein [Rhodospirillaceae bacterium]